MDLTFSFFFVSLLSGEVAVFGVDASVGVVTSAVSAGDSPPDSCFVSFTSSCWNKRNLWMIEPCVYSPSLPLFLHARNYKKIEERKDAKGIEKPSDRLEHWVISFVSNIRTSP